MIAPVTLLPDMLARVWPRPAAVLARPLTFLLPLPHAPRPLAAAACARACSGAPDRVVARAAMLLHCCAAPCAVAAHYLATACCCRYPLLCVPATALLYCVADVLATAARCAALQTAIAAALWPWPCVRMCCVWRLN